MEKMPLTKIFVAILICVALTGADIQYAERQKAFSVSQVKASDVLEATPSATPKAENVKITVTFGTPVPTPKPVTVEDKIRAVFKEEADNAFKILSCENRSLNPKAINHNTNGTWDAGIFQINQIHKYSLEYLFDVDNNIQAAYKIFKASGWNAWSCSRKIEL